MLVRLSSSRCAIALSTVASLALSMMLLAMTVHAQMSYANSTPPVLTLPPPPEAQTDPPIPFPIHPSRCRWQVRYADGPCAGQTTTCQAGVCASGVTGAPSTSRTYFDSVYLIEELPGPIGMAVNSRLETKPCWEDRTCKTAPHLMNECKYSGSSIWYCQPDATGVNNCYMFQDGDVTHTEKYEATTLIDCINSFDILAMRLLQR